MTIYDSSGTAIYIAPVTKDAIIKNTLMEEYYIELSFNVIDVVPFGRGCYILHKGRKFEIMSNVHPEPLSSGNGYHYTLRFESQQSQMKRCNVFWRDGDNLEVSFALTSDISTFGQLIIDNVNAFLGGSTFSLGSVPSGAEMKTISFAGDSCWDAVATIAETFGVEWWTDEDGDNVRLCFGKLEIGESVEFKKGDIVSSIPSKKGDDANYGTRFYVFGSTKNLPEDYGSTEEGGITNNVVEKRLHLPNGMQYIDAWPNLASEDIVEKTVFFEDVMPTNVETITEVYSGNAEVIPGTSHKVYDVVCANSPFTLDDVIEGETIQANFTSGSLNGQTFDLELTQTSGVFNKTFRIVPKILDNDSLTILPQGEMIPRAGDTFILLNVNLPKGRIDEAEQRLLEVGQEYVKKNSSDTEIYDCPTNAVYCHKNDCNYVLGQRVTLVGDMFGDGRQSRIQGYEKKLYDEYQATYTVGDNSAYSRLASLEKSIRQAVQSERVGLEANIIRSKNDSTIPSDFNIYSALATEEYFLSKRKGGIVKGHTNFEKGISMYGIPFVYDEETKTWVLEGNLVVTRGISAFSSLSTPVASLFEALPIDGVTIKRDPVTNELYVDTNVVGGSGGGSLDEEQLEEYLKPYAKTADVANTYATKSSVNALSTQLNDFLSGSDTDTIINKWSELEAFLAGLAETDNLATILSGKANKATTLAGYGITDAYTKSHIDSNFVTIGTKQEITGEKDFVGVFKVNGGLVEYNATLKTWVFNGDLLVTGGMAAFSNISGFKPSTITDAVLIDDRTIKRNADGLLYAVAQETDGINEEQLADYLTTNGYATQSWVTGKGYFLASNFTKANIKSALGISDWALASARPTYTASEVGALGVDDTAQAAKRIVTDESSINATTWNGVAGLSVGGWNSNGAGFSNTYGTTINFQGISTWYHRLAFATDGVIEHWMGINTTTMHKVGRIAYMANIPTSLKNPNALSWSGFSSGSYDGSTAQSIAIPSNTNQLTNGAGFITASASITGNAATATLASTLGGGHPSDASNKLSYLSGQFAPNATPTAGQIYIGSSEVWGVISVPKLDGNTLTANAMSLRMAFNTKFWHEIAATPNNNNLYHRSVRNGVGNAWSTILNSSNYSDYALPKDGTAVAASKLATTRSIFGQNFDGSTDVSGNIFPINASGCYYNENGISYHTNKQYQTSILRVTSSYNVAIGGTTASEKLHVYGNIRATGALSCAGATVDGDLIFTDADAGRKYGIFKDGYVRFNVTTSGAWATGLFVYSNDGSTQLGTTAGAFGSGGNLSYFYYGGTWNNPYMAITNAGNVGIGTISPSEKLHVYGNILATGGITAQNSSDRRLKRNLRKFNASKVLMSLGAVWEYEYIDSEVQKNHIYEGTHYGLIYQHVKGTALDVMCHEREDGMGALNYIHQKFISLIAGATMENISEVEKLKRKIRHLENKVKQLENRA